MKEVAVVQSLISSEVAVPLDSALALGKLKERGIPASFHDLNHDDPLPVASSAVYLSTYTVVPYSSRHDFPLIRESVQRLLSAGISNVVVGTQWMSADEINELLRMGVAQVLKGDTTSLLDRFLSGEHERVLLQPWFRSVHSAQASFQKIPVDRYRKSFFSRGKNSLPMIFSRGCDLDCTYCPVEASLERMKPTEIVESITRLIAETGVNHLMIEDDLFNSSSAFVEEFCDLMNTNFPQISWECLNGLHPGLLRAETWKALADSRCLHLSLGLEVFDEILLRSKQRIYDWEKTMEGVRHLGARGIAVSGYFLFDLMLDESGSLWRQLSIMKGTPLTSLHLSSLRELTYQEKILRTISLIYLHSSSERLFLLYKLGYISLGNTKRLLNKLLGSIF